MSGSLSVESRRRLDSVAAGGASTLQRHSNQVRSAMTSILSFSTDKPALFPCYKAVASCRCSSRFTPESYATGRRSAPRQGKTGKGLATMIRVVGELGEAVRSCAP